MASDKERTLGDEDTPARPEEAEEWPVRRGYIPRVPNHLVWAIFSVLFFLPSGIAAVIYASRVDGLLASGHVAGAWEASAKSKVWCIVSTVIFMVWVVVLAAALALALGLGVNVFRFL